MSNRLQQQLEQARARNKARLEQGQRGGGCALSPSEVSRLTVSGYIRLRPSEIAVLALTGAVSVRRDTFIQRRRWCAYGQRGQVRMVLEPVAFWGQSKERALYRYSDDPAWRGLAWPKLPAKQMPLAAVRFYVLVENVVMTLDREWWLLDLRRTQKTG